jgi:hypothetical protein
MENKLLLENAVVVPNLSQIFCTKYGSYKEDSTLQ